jgi:hypothetical protein
VPRRRRRSLSARTSASFTSQSRTASWLKTMPRRRSISPRISQRQAVAQPPRHHQGDDVRRILCPSPHCAHSAAQPPWAANTSTTGAKPDRTLHRE